MSEAKKVKKTEAENEQPNLEAEKEGMGEIRISSDVVSIIASNAALEVPGIAHFSGGIAGNISQVLGRKNPFKGIKVDITENRERFQYLLPANAWLEETKFLILSRTYG
jgi:hypothetical protein